MTLIRIDSLHQPTLDNQRGRLDQSRVRYFRSHPDEIRDVLVYEDPETRVRILVNGHHRVEAARTLGRADIDADVYPGTPVDATKYQDSSERRVWSDIEGESCP